MKYHWPLLKDHYLAYAELQHVIPEEELYEKL